MGTLSLDGTARTAFANTALGEQTFGSAGWIIGVAGLAILIEVLVIVIRFCNIGLVNLMIKGFLIVVSRSMYRRVFIFPTLISLRHAIGKDFTVDQSVNFWNTVNRA